MDTPGRLPTMQDFIDRRVTNPAQSEVQRQRFYDYELYPTAGQQQLSMFSRPIGQGITTALGAVVGSAKTEFDTNLVQANTLPSGKTFMAQSIEVLFFAGSVSTANTYTPANLAVFNATASQATLNTVGGVNDVNSFYQSGSLTFRILDKDYLIETPLGAFPPKAELELAAGIASNAAATSMLAFAKAKAGGRPYYLEPEISLQPTVNFAVNLRWPAAFATPSGFNARIGVILDGYFARASQ